MPAQRSTVADGPGVETPASERRFRFGVGAAALVGFVIRLWAVATVSRRNPTAGDGFYYHAQANLLVQGDWFADPYRTNALAGVVPGNAHPPVYTMWLSISSLLGGTDFRAHKTMACLAGVLLVVAVGLLARELAGRRAGLIAAGIAAANPSFWIIGGLLMPEELYAAFVAFVLLLVCRWRRRPSWPLALWAGVLLGLAVLTRAEAVLFGPLLFVPVMLLPGRLTLAWRRRVLHLTVAGLACVAILAPWVIRNAVTFERFQPFSTNGDELFVYANNPIAYGTATEPVVCSRKDVTDDGGTEGKVLQPEGTKYLGYWYFPWQQFLRCEHGEPTGDPSEISLYWRDRGIEYAKDHRSRLPVVVAARIGRTWEVFRPFDNVRFGRIEGRTLWVSQLGLYTFWGLLAGSVPGLIVLRRRRVTIWPLLSCAAAVTVTVAYAYGNERFRLPVDVAVSVAAAVALDAVARRRWPVTPAAAGRHEALAADETGDGGVTEVAARAPGVVARAWLDAMRAWPWRTIAMWAAIAIVLALPFRGLMRSPGGPMEEGFMLTFPERILHGDLPNRDFLYLYGPGSLWSLASLYWLFGTSVATERIFGALQVVGMAAGMVWLLRPFGRFLAAVGAIVCILVVAPALGFTALPWNGGVALLLLALGLAGSARWEGDEARDPDLRRLGLAGVLAGLALLFRPDLVLALALAGTAVLWALPRRAIRRAIGGLLVGVAPILAHLATAGPGHVIDGMFIDPVFRLRGGRTLPVPPSWHELEVFMQRPAAYVAMPWPFPHLSLPAEVAAWFWLVPIVALTILAAALVARRRAPGARRTQVLLVGALLSLGLLPQAFQRADVPHFAWASCVSLGFLPAAIASLIGDRRTTRMDVPLGWRSAVGTASVAVLLLCAIPLLTVRTYTEQVKRSLGTEVAGWPIRRHDRSFSYGSPDIAAAGNQLVADLDARAKPGQRLFVGPEDLRKTPYNQAFWYFLYPDLVPATYYIELDPWLANRPGSRLADDVASADWLILTSIGAGWDEPNLSRRVGSDAPNEVVRRDFCLVGSYGRQPGETSGIWELYERCAPQTPSTPR